MKYIVLLLVIITVTGCNSAHWDTVMEANPEVSFTVAGYINEDLIVTGGFAGRVFYGTVEGDVWTPGSNNSRCRYTMDTTGEDLMFLAGNGGTVSMSTDGKVWKLLKTPVSSRLYLVSFYTENIGCVVNSMNELFYTENQGKSWRQLDLPDTNTKVIAINHYTKNEIIAMDTSGILYYTKDLGTSWTNKTLNIKGYDINPDYLDFHSAVIRFTNGEEGTIAVIAPDKEQIIVLDTVDGMETNRKSIINYAVPAKTKLVLSHDRQHITVSEIGKITVFRRK